MQRYFVPRDQWNDESVTIIGDDAGHIARVMRMKHGNSVICSNGEGLDSIVTLTSVTPSHVTGDITRQLQDNREPSIWISLAQGLAKGDKMDLVIQKGTEIGMKELIPFSSARAIVQLDEKKEAKRLDRWQKIAKEAAEQAHRSIIPEIRHVLTWKQLLNVKDPYDLKLVAYENEVSVSLQQALQSVTNLNVRVLLVIGPEGGFTEEEIIEAESRGFQSVQVGKRILRTETAGLVGLSCILYHYGEMGG